MKEKKKYIFLILYIITILLIFFLSLRDANESTDDSGFVMNIVLSILKIFKDEQTINIELVSLLVRKLIGHYGMFCICGLFGYFTYNSFIETNKIKVLVYILSGIFIAVIAELLQLVSPGRSCQISDMFIDYSGYITSLLLCIVLSIIIKSKQKD